MSNAGSENAVDWTIDFPKKQSLLIRTDYSDDDRWRMLGEAACATNEEGFQANLVFVDDRQLDGASVEALLAAVGDNYLGAFFVADSRAIADLEHPILMVKTSDLVEDDDPDTLPRGATFRVIPSKYGGRKIT